MTDFEDRRKMIETERATMELTGDSVDVKPTITRKLRRRPNEPLPVPEKRRKPTTGQLVLLLDEKEVENDLKLISRGKATQAMRNHQQQQQQQQQQQANGSASGSSNSHSQMSSAATTASNGTAVGQQSNSVAPSTTPTPASTPSLVSNSYQMTSSCNSSTSVTAAPAAPTVTSNELTLALPQQQQSTPPAPQPAAVSPAQPTNPPPPPPSSTTTNGQQPTSTSQQQQNNNQPLVETRIEDGKLLYERRWFHRGQPVYVEGRDIQRFSANISAIGSEAIWVKKTTDGQKVRIFTNQLSRGKVSIKRRAN